VDVPQAMVCTWNKDWAPYLPWLLKNTLLVCSSTVCLLMITRKAVICRAYNNCTKSCCFPTSNVSSTVVKEDLRRMKEKGRKKKWDITPHDLCKFEAEQC
jgi:hypothetical protein